jgi:hypothetical protein
MLSYSHLKCTFTMDFVPERMLSISFGSDGKLVTYHPFLLSDEGSVDREAC